jgi:hypothetical protein
VPMITTRVIPAATATTQDLLIEVIEKVCRPYCVNSSIQPSATVAFTQGPITILNSKVICPVMATITIVTPNSNGCGCSHVQTFTEKFDLAFSEGTTNVVTLTPGTASIVVPTDMGCCKARSVKLTTTLTATIA